MRKRRFAVLAGMAAATIVAGVIAAGADSASAGDNPVNPVFPVSVKIVSPANNNNAGLHGSTWFIDLKVDYPGGPAGRTQAGFTGAQLTGPGAHNNVAPFAGTFSTGHDDRLPGLVVLLSTSPGSERPGFSGPGTNLANLFNITGVTNETKQETEISDTWLVAAPIFGQDVDSTLTVAVVDDLNHNGVFDDAPDVVTDLNGDGVVDGNDLKVLGVASTIQVVNFHITGA